jgi:hypothetical protein
MRKAVALLSIGCVLLWAALPASDTFTRSNGTLGANWTDVIGVTQLFSNHAAGNSAGSRSGAIWNADVFANDQYSEVILGTAIGTSAYSGAMVRGTTGQFYGCYTDTANAYLVAYYSGASHTLATHASPGYVVGDTLRLEASGTTLTCYRNGASSNTAADSHIASGSAGVYFYGNLGAVGDTNWTGGNLGGTTVQRRRSYGQ